MKEFLPLLAHHGYLIIFLTVFAEALGLPVPAALALLAGGAAAATGILSMPEVIPAAVAGMLLGDSLLYTLGHRTGWRLLGFLCKVSLNSDTCILRAAEWFYKRGRATLLIAKFVPGVNALVPPLAGSMKLPLAQFLILDLAGAVFYTLTYGVIGFLFRDFVRLSAGRFRMAGYTVAALVLVASIPFVAYRLSHYRKFRSDRIVPRVAASELAGTLQSEESRKVLIVDVRSQGYYDPDAVRIKGSIRIEPDNLFEEVKKLPRNANIYLYCT